jgi:hypothetical protein
MNVEATLATHFQIPATIMNMVAGYGKTNFQILCWILKFYPLPWTPLYISPLSAAEALHLFLCAINVDVNRMLFNGYKCDTPICNPINWEPAFNAAEDVFGSGQGALRKNLDIYIEGFLAATGQVLFNNKLASRVKTGWAQETW